MSSQRGVEYARMNDAERCAAAGRILRDLRFAYVYRPDLYDQLLAENQCLRPEQIPAWVYADIDDPERIPEEVRREDQYIVQTQTLCGGRGSGKGHAGSCYWAWQLLEIPGFRLEILGPSFNISMGVDINGDSGIIKQISSVDAGLIRKLDAQKNILHLKNGSIVIARSSEYPKSIEGENFHAIWVDEPAELYHQGGDSCIYRSKAEPGVRLPGPEGQPVRKLITGTPDDASELQLDLADSVDENPTQYAWSTLKTRDNIANLDAAVVEDMYARGSAEFIDQKLEGNFRRQSQHALVTEEVFIKCRKVPGEKEWCNPDDLDECVMSVDSSHSDDKKSDECGILIGGHKGRFGYMMADASVKGGSEVWGKRIIDVLKAFPEIDVVLVEDDKSLVLDVVGRVLRDHMQELGRVVKIRPMHHHNKSKKKRADPVAAEYHLTHVYHCPAPRVPEWHLRDYEQQWKIWNPKAKGSKSPDRVDAGVYLVTDQVIGRRESNHGWAASDVAKWAR